MQTALIDILCMLMCFQHICIFRDFMIRSFWVLSNNIFGEKLHRTCQSRITLNKGTINRVVRCLNVYKIRVVKNLKYKASDNNIFKFEFCYTFEIEGRYKYMDS